ncbi:unnamed protein product, partial [Effrenium voratum]
QTSTPSKCQPPAPVIVRRQPPGRKGSVEPLALAVMDLEAYSWACGSSIRALQAQQEKPETQREPTPTLQDHRLLSLWYSAVHVAAESGDVEDLEVELGPAAELPRAQAPIPEAEEEEEGAEGEAKEAGEGEHALVPVAASLPLEPVQAEPAKTAEPVPPKEDGFLAVLSAWSDDAPASRLLEEARLVPSKGTKAVRGAPGPLRTRDRAPNKEYLEKLRSRFQSRAASPPAEAKRWTRQDFELYFGSDGAFRPRLEPPPHTEEELAKEMQLTSRASPLLAELRMQLAADGVTSAPAEYRAFCRHLLEQCEPCALPVAEVTQVPRVKRITEQLKSPICVEKQRGWKMR